jgi:hypothetical protein
MEHKVNIPWPLRIIPDEILIPLRPLLLRITRQHALQTHTDALDIVDGRPTRAVEQVEADDAVGIDVRVPGDGVVGVANEGDFWGLRDVGLVWFVDRREEMVVAYLDGVLWAEGKFQAVGFV